MLLAEAEKELEQYIKIKSPNYAIEITGDWGIGKTFFIKNYIKKKSWFGVKRPIYISLYGIKSQSEIENLIWVKALFCNLTKTIITIITIVLVSLLLCLTMKWLFYSKEDTFFQILGIVGTSLLCIIAWFYKTFKTSIFVFLLLGNTIVFDDFERAEMPFDLLLAYINRYVEHLHKHIVIICNDKEIKEKDDVPNQLFFKLQEKVVGKVIYLEQDKQEVMEVLLKQGEYNILPYIVNLNERNKDFFYNFSRPQECSVNYRVWNLCCREFERVFYGLSLDYFKETKIVRNLLPSFFALAYALHLNDFGENRIFTKESAKTIFAGYENDDDTRTTFKNNYKWFFKIFLLKMEAKTILPDSVWDCIIDDQSVNQKEIMQHWDLLLDTKQPLWLQLYNYLEKTDEELRALWEELIKTYQSRSIHEPSQIVSIYSSVLDMIENNCCPDPNMTKEKAFQLALQYVVLFFDEPINKVFRYQTRLFKNCETYGHHQASSHYFKEFERHFSSFLLSYEQHYFVPENFNAFLSKLDLEEEDFDEFWKNSNVRFLSLFEQQSAPLLIEKLLSLSPRKMKDRLYTIQEYFVDSTYPLYALLQFEKDMLNEFNRIITDNKTTVDHTKIYWIKEALPGFEEDIRKKEEELNNRKQQSTSTDKEPEQ